MSKRHTKPPPSPEPAFAVSHPPLNAVRVFVEAARQCNFSRAALNLGMTQSGVSRHVAHLENWLGQPLFTRAGGQLRLTDAGRLYQDTVKDAVATIDLASRQLKGPHRSVHGERLAALRVRTSLPTFSMSVLVPALSRFQAIHQVEVEIMTALSPPAPGDFCDVLVTRDLVVPDAEQWHLAGEDLMCVAAPSLHHRCESEPMRNWPFLAPRSRPDILLRWAAAIGIGAEQIQISAGFDHFFLAIAAAQSGAGVLVAPRCLVLDLLRQGMLLALPVEPVRGDASYVAFVLPSTQRPDTARAFCRWLKGVLAGEVY